MTQITRRQWSIYLLIATIILPPVGGMVNVALADALKLSGHMVGPLYFLLGGLACAAALSSTTMVVAIRELRGLDGEDRRRTRSWLALGTAAAMALCALLGLLYLLLILSSDY